MRQRITYISAMSILLVSIATFVRAVNPAPTYPKAVPIELRDTSNKPVPVPFLGEKHLLIFYPDPDHAFQNSAFTDYLEDHPIDSPNIFGFGVVNLKDAPLLPDVLIRGMIRNKVRKTGALILTDPDRTLSTQWQLGDVNNLFTLIFVTKDCDIVYVKKGKMDEADTKEFFALIDQYK